MTKQEYEEQDDLEKQMEEWALAEPEPPEWEWYDENHPTADAEPPEWYLQTEQPEWMEQELLEQQYKEEQEPVSAEQELLDLHNEWLMEHHAHEQTDEEEQP
ncbi:MAG: hypothetical protein IKP00_07000 [Victivallales bacterium]|nr:hypothetical protein [Victivallales bacterium]